MRHHLIRSLAIGIGAACALVACSSDEDPGNGHTPESVALYDATTGVELPQPTAGEYALPAGATTRVEVHFYNAADEDISDEIIAEHFTSLTFTPGTFATVADVAGERFQRDVTVAAAAGTDAPVAVGYGHDAAADELSFPLNVTAVP